MLAVGILVSALPAQAASVFVGNLPATVNPGQQFQIEVGADVGSTVLGSYFFNFVYDPAVVNIVSVAGGATAEFSTPPAVNTASFNTGLTPVAAAQASRVAPTGKMSLARITLVAIGAPGAVSPLNLQNAALNGGNGNPLTVVVAAANVQLSFDAGTDADGDGLTNVQEAAARTDINNPDTDGDGLRDGFEVTYKLDPLDNGSVDANNGGNGDPDGDTLTNLQEQTAGTNPKQADTDNDGVRDDAELRLGTNPINADSDGDGLPDGYEINSGLNPLDNGNVNPNNGANGDPDGDGLTNAQELAAGTRANLADTDGDGLPDSYEVANGLNPNDNGSIDARQGASGDVDQDGYSNLQEFQIGSNPQDRHSQPVDMQLQLQPGLQPVVYPLNLPPGFSAYEWLTALAGGQGRVTAIRALENGSTLRTAKIAGGVLSGTDFILTPGHGVLAEVQTTGTLTFRGAVQCPVMNLTAGVNVVGLVCVPADYTAVRMLLNIGGPTQVSAIQRFDAATGRYQTVLYQNPNGDVRGIDFRIQPGEAYLVHMRTGRPGFDPWQ